MISDFQIVCFKTVPYFRFRYAILLLQPARNSLAVPHRSKIEEVEYASRGS